jgi:hypothetical protein
MTTSKEAPKKPVGSNQALAYAIAVVQGHPDPDAFAAAVKDAFEEYVAKHEGAK